MHKKPNNSPKKDNYKQEPFNDALKTALDKLLKAPKNDEDALKSTKLPPDPSKPA